MSPQVNSSFIPIDSDDDLPNTGEPIPLLGELDPYANSVFERFPEPQTLSDLISLNNFIPSLCKGFVFIHNRKESSDHLVGILASCISQTQPQVRFSYFQTHNDDLDSLYKKIEGRKGIGLSATDVWIIDTTSSNDEVNKFCVKIAKIPNLPVGLWFRGYVRDFNPKVLTLFDVLFLFDMSNHEQELLRSIIPCPDNGLRDQFLVYLNYRRLKNIPIIEDNPTILSSWRKDITMFDTEKFMPIIVLATKFVFNEVSKWIDSVRKSASEGEVSKSEEKQLDESLPVPADVLTEEQLQPFVNAAVAADNCQEIESLVKQIRQHRTNLFEEQEKASRYGIDIPVHVRNTIRHEATEVTKKTAYLKKLLSAVYQRS